ncbi:hypothetical protein [Mangrovicoccus algicola]|uniref:Uncharacterized protein n=1 Tax=Mangrovicoccus algicola TaxID=2771008 RepID=A0A8J6YYK1_9RHOB|nr:hypothetical protein [Mangrovicoccus algicola]MBE3638361.1 hypothetical protein [Mangrovicoccus algicola]
MSVLLADSALAARQVIVSGRLVEGITGRPLPVQKLDLLAGQGASRMALEARAIRKPGGWYALHLVPGHRWPGFSDMPDVTLELAVTLPDRPPVVTDLTLPAAALRVESRVLQVGTTPVTVSRVAGAPFRMDLELPPHPVSLALTVIRDHDPGAPVEGVGVTVLGAPAAVTDAAGKALIADMPVLETVVVALQHDGGMTHFPVRPDFTRRLNTVTLSLGAA